jgi:small-conductance mechanosensitive channel
MKEKNKKRIKVLFFGVSQFLIIMASIIMAEEFYKQNSTLLMTLIGIGTAVLGIIIQMIIMDKD